MVEAYAYHKRNNCPDMTEQQISVYVESGFGLKEYFDASVGPQLLYKPEKARHQEIMANGAWDVFLCFAWRTL